MEPAKTKRILFDEISRSPSDTEELGARIGGYLLTVPANPPFVALYGDLGAGKTAFVTGLARVITPGAHVSSPTYALVNEYASPGRKLYHFDMYRITSDDDLFSTGFYDFSGYMAAEWCENIPFALPDRRIEVRISRLENENERRITASLVSDGED